MDPIRDSKAEQQFQEMLAKLTSMPEWSEKQQLELEMAREISGEMLRLAEVMRDGTTDMETCLTMLKYAKVMDFVLTTLASRRGCAADAARNLQARRAESGRGLSWLNGCLHTGCT